MAVKTEYSKKLTYNNAYNRKTYKSFSVRFNKNTEAEYIDWLSSKESLKDYLTGLIDKDMNKVKKKQKKDKREHKKKASPNNN